MLKPKKIGRFVQRFQVIFLGLIVLLCCTYSCKEDPCPQREPDIQIHLLKATNEDTISIELDSLYAINEKKPKVSRSVQLDLNSERSTYVFLAQGRQDTVYFDYEIVIRTGFDDAYCISLENLRVSSPTLEIVCLDYYHGYERHSNVVNNENLCYGPGLTVLY